MQRLTALTNDLETLRAQLNNKNYRISKCFQILPGYKIENSF